MNLRLNLTKSVFLLSNLSLWFHFLIKEYFSQKCVVSIKKCCAFEVKNRPRAPICGPINNI